MLFAEKKASAKPRQIRTCAKKKKKCKKKFDIDREKVSKGLVFRGQPQRRLKREYKRVRVSIYYRVYRAAALYISMIIHAKSN